MKDLAIFGAGGLGREIACLIHRINDVEPTWNLIGFFDDGKNVGTSNEYGKVIGGINELNNYPKSLSVTFSIGSPKIISSIVGKITNKMIDYPNIISPDIIYLDPKNINIGKGNIFCSGCLLSCNVEIGDFNIFNGFIPIGHDTRIGSFNTFMPAVKISGSVNIGDRNFFGVNSVVLQGLNIGFDTTVGASSLIIRKTIDGMTYIGIPAKVINY